MNKKKIAAILVFTSCISIGRPAFATTIQSNPETNNISLLTNTTNRLSTSRLSGDTRYETAKVISEYYNKGSVQNVVLATGNEFADALSASVLAYEKQAPILLVDSTVNSSKDAFEYILKHFDPTGTIYIVGGTGIINTEFVSKLKDLGFKNVVRVAGLDRYETSYEIANALMNKAASTVVISSGEQYPDALSISSFAANKGWPILLSPQGNLPQNIKNYLKEKKPSKVFLTGGVGAISDNVIAEIKEVIPQVSVERLTGQSRFDTNVNITETFANHPSTVYLATGYGFADALSGSVVAAENGEPILFIDSAVASLPKSVANYFEKLYANKISPNIISLGGSGVVPDEIIKSSSDLILGVAKGTTIHSIADIMATVTQNEVYSLPSTVQARLYNSETLNLPVKWNTALADTRSIGSSEYEGVINGYSKTIKLKLTVKEPIPIPIAQYTTYFKVSEVNRTENIRLAAKALDGQLLAPGERFSFNERVGERTAEAGYKEALIIEGDVFTPGLGGGICQVSSTLYNAVMLAHLEIVERHPHSLPISYVPPGQDATVAYPYLDFKFRNSSKEYLLIRSFVKGDALTFQFFKKSKNE
jgi:putative cell wall-binding protein